MIKFAEIQKHYSSAENNLPRMVLKEYLQYKILEIIFASPFGESLVFMGGTCIRIAYGNDRFSEDLDLDNRGLSEGDFERLAQHIGLELKKEGVNAEFRNAYKDFYHCYLRFPGLLFDNKLSALRDEKILIRIDSFSTKETDRAVARVISKADIFAEILCYPSSHLLAQKIQALFGRQRAKGRDIYDIVYLWSMTEPDYSYLKKVLQIGDRRELLEKMKGLFSEAELKGLAEDVEPFLISPQKSLQVKKFRAWIDAQLH